MNLRSLGLMAVALCGFGCDSRPPISPAPPPPVPSAAAQPGIPNEIGITYDPDLFNTPAPKDDDGTFVLGWGRGSYCLFILNIPEIPSGACRLYSLTFGWPAAGVFDYGRKCHTAAIPTGVGGACFDAPLANTIDPRQTILVTAVDRFDGREIEVLRTVVRIKFETQS